MKSITSLGQSCLCILSLFGVLAAGQDKPTQAPPPQRPAPIISPEVHADGSVTFRLRDPNAVEVKLGLEGAEPVPMKKDDGDGWSVTTAPLAPDYYGYEFIADGERMLDPSNHLLVPNLLTPGNAVHVPGPLSLPWELNEVPHGEVHHHFYKSAVAGDDRDYYVYTPPGYDPVAKKTYPVLYLLHGYSDDASGWTAVGHANVILDNLIAQGKAKPMLVVMPLGYGTMEMIWHSWASWSHPDLRDTNFRKFSEALLTEVMPRVEGEYRITKDRNARAIAGLSMGGSESLLTGLNNLDKFSWIGAFSSGGIPEDFQKDFPALDAKANQQIHLLWIACGTEDHLITVNRNFRGWLKTKGVKATEIETPGMHTWMVWRRNLSEFAPLLFH
ncbi:MAG TPA: alpha/beta hydrolase-fold protein [Verrucomicrobiae bacterium]|jgi:enterochelin esterase-like enzyme|nr:alpha/beta hydrolase-fold protein [Verrucomicrobiae bacterium]